MEISLLMTATISPRNCPGAMFTPQERRKRYLNAFKFYLEKLEKGVFPRLVFAENSDSDLKDFYDAVPDGLKDRVELLSAPATLFPEALGKNNEFPLIDYAVDNSKLLASSDGFFKVTGRYFFRNIKSLIRDVVSVKTPLDLYCDQKDHRLFSALGLKKKERDGETRFFYSTLDFWRKNFYGCFAGNPEWRRVEDIMCEVALSHYGDDRCRFRFKHQPLTGGDYYAGSDGEYIISMGIKMPPRLYFFLDYFRWMAESLIRRVFPRFWF